MQNEFNNFIFNKDYKNPNISQEIIQLVKKYDSLTYNSQIAEELLTELNIDDNAENMDKAETIVYLARKVIRAEKEAAKDVEALAAGWQKINSTAPITYRGPALLKAKQSIDFLSLSLEKAGKIVDSGRKDQGNNPIPFFIPKGNRTRGYWLHSLKGYWKPLSINN